MSQSGIALTHVKSNRAGFPLLTRVSHSIEGWFEVLDLTTQTFQFSNSRNDRRTSL